MASLRDERLAVELIARQRLNQGELEPAGQIGDGDQPPERTVREPQPGAVGGVGDLGDEPLLGEESGDPFEPGAAPQAGELPFGLLALAGEPVGEELLEQIAPALGEEGGELAERPSPREGASPAAVAVDVGTARSPRCTPARRDPARRAISGGSARLAVELISSSSRARCTAAPLQQLEEAPLRGAEPGTTIPSGVL